MVWGRHSSAGSKARAGVAPRRAVSEDIAPNATPASAAEAALQTPPRKARRESRQSLLLPDTHVLVVVPCGKMTHAR